MDIDGKPGFIQLADGSTALDLLPPHPKLPRQLGKVFHGSFVHADETGCWLIRCQYCGACCLGESLEEAGRDFDKHMHSAFDSSKQHFEYAAGKRKPTRSKAKTFKGLLRYQRKQAVAAHVESRQVQ